MPAAAPLPPPADSSISAPPRLRRRRRSHYFDGTERRGERRSTVADVGRAGPPLCGAPALEPPPPFIPSARPSSVAVGLGRAGGRAWVGSETRRPRRRPRPAGGGPRGAAPTRCPRRAWGARCHDFDDGPRPPAAPRPVSERTVNDDGTLARSPRPRTDKRGETDQRDLRRRQSENGCHWAHFTGLPNWRVIKNNGPV